MEDSGLSLKGSTILTDTLLQIFKYSRLNKIYSESKDQSPLVAINLLLDQLELNIDLPDDDLPNIPEKGPFIAVSNHPFRGIDSMLLFKLIYSRRDDFKIMASHLLKDILPLSKIIIPVNTYESSGEEESSYRGIREGLAHLRDGHCIGIFPTAEDSKHWDAPKIILDQD
jgi:putative hemolysin